MKNLISVFTLLLFTSIIYSQGTGPVFYSGVSVNGVDVYQDATDKTQFYFVPSSIDLVLGETLKDFKTTYWGIGNPFYVKLPDGRIKSTQGAILSGRAVFDITDGQRKSVLDEIKNTFNISNPKLKKLAIRNLSVEPVFAENTLEFGDRSDIKFPEEISIGSDFSFLLATGNNLFGSAVATAEPNWRVTPNPNFGINVVGESQFVGAPWKAKVTADLSQVWKEVRQRYSASVKVGWFKIGSAEFNKVVQDLKRKGVIKFEMIEGSLENDKHGRQIFDVIKKVFEDLNSKATAGKGFFKFEPNPRAAEVRSGSHGKFSGWWGVSINGGYSSAHFKQSIKFEETIEYTGRFWSNVPMSLTLAVSCSPATSHMFKDLSDNSDPCVTDEKIKETNARLQREAKERNKKLFTLDERYAAGEITQEQYDRLLDLYNRYTFTEDLSSLTKSTMTIQAFSTAHLENLGFEETLKVGLSKSELEEAERQILGEQ